jgi:flagellar biosynthesis/type III secretory pathway protein FliH
MSNLTVADELAYDALPDDTRALCDKILAHRIGSEVDTAVQIERREAYNSGYCAGTDDGYAEGKEQGLRIGHQRGYDAAVAERRKAEGDAAAS